MARPRDSPGVHSARALLEGEPLEGLWYDRSAFGEARRGGGRGSLEDFAEKLKRSPAPRSHAATKEAWRALADAYREVMTAFREAAELLKLGEVKPGFPPGSFPPGMPYLPHQAPG